MARLRFTIGTSYKLRGEVFSIRQLLVGGAFQVENQSFGGVFVVLLADLVNAWAIGTALSRASLERWLSDFTESGYERAFCQGKSSMRLALQGQPHTLSVQQ